MGLFTMSHSFTNESIYEKSLRVYKDIVLTNPYEYNKCKKLQFIHKLTASDTSKTAIITKR